MVTYFQAYFKTGCKEFTNNSSTCQLGVSAVCCKLWPFQDTFNFNRDHSDRGWHKGFVKAMHSARDSCFYIVTSFRDQRNCLPALNLHTDSVPSPAKLFQVVPSCWGSCSKGFFQGLDRGSWGKSEGLADDVREWLAQWSRWAVFACSQGLRITKFCCSWKPKVFHGNGPPKFIMQGPNESRWVMIIPTGSNRLCLAVPSPVPLGVPCNSLLQSALRKGWVKELAGSAQG